MSYYTAQQPQLPVQRKRRRIFLWVFLAIQALFVIWLVTAIATNRHASNCGSLDASTCQSAYDAGKAIGVGVILVFWVIVDAIVGGGYAIYRLARRPK